MKNGKAMTRMLSAIPKMRAALSADTEASIQVDDLIDNEDYEYEMSRDQLEEIIRP